MIKQELGDHIVEIYDSIDDLPIARFHKYNKFMLIDGGVGSDMRDVNNHISKIQSYLSKNESDLAAKELDNLRQNFYMITQEMSPKYLAFAALVKSIDGKEVFDLSDDNLKAVVKQLSKVKVRTFEKILALLKKKIDTELELFFPSEFSNSRVKEYYDQLRKRALLQLQGIKTGNPNQSEIDKIDEFLLFYSKPSIFSGKNSLEIKYEKQFKELCRFITEHAFIKAEDLTVLDFYSSLDYIKKKLKAKEKANKRRKRKNGR
jgi:hypothetical protein